jgi:uncharacterized protein (TIGR02757 family)
MKLSAADTELKRELDRLRKKIERPEFIAADPVQFPRRYVQHNDIEISAFLAATIAWGRRDLIIRSCERMFALMGPSPADFVMSGKFRKLGSKNGERRCVHRTFFEDDLLYFCKGFRHCYAKYGSLENLFATAAATDKGGATDKSAFDIWQGISLFREEMAAGNGKTCQGTKQVPGQVRYTKHIANPNANSACKRINLALRWLVRQGPVDIGLWKRIRAVSLFIPLDVHVARTARKLGLLRRKSNDQKAVIELTGKLREFCAKDPVRYDFALFGM